MSATTLTARRHIKNYVHLKKRAMSVKLSALVSIHQEDKFTTLSHVKPKLRVQQPVLFRHAPVEDPLRNVFSRGSSTIQTASFLLALRPDKCLTSLEEVNRMRKTGARVLIHFNSDFDNEIVRKFANAQKTNDNMYTFAISNTISQSEFYELMPLLRCPFVA